MAEALLVLIGIVVGAIGTLVGAGGGFLLVPIFLLLHPEEPPEVVTAISLTIVLVNSISGSLAYARQRRIDLPLGLALAFATVPGAVAGALVVNRVDRSLFTLLFCAVLLVVAGLLVFRPPPILRERERRRGDWSRELVDRDGNRYRYRVAMPPALALSLGVGFLSSLLGIGGGIIQVPIFILLFGVPTYVATATSSFMLVLMSLSGTLANAADGDLADALPYVLYLAPGVIAGSQIGAWLSRRTSPRLITRILAAAMTLAALRLLYAQLT